MNTYAYVENNPTNLIDPLGLFGFWPFGNPLGGNNSTPVPMPTLNGSVGSGGSSMFLMNYMSADSGMAFDTRGNICFYSTICNGIGWQTPAGGELGGVLGVGAGELCSEEETFEGVYWSGGEGFVGQGQVMNDGSYSRLMFGVGGSPEGSMAGAGGLSCTRRLVCR